MPREQDDETGKFTQSYPLEAFIDALEAEGGMAGTKAIEERVGCSYQLAHKRLMELEDDGRVSSRKVGNARLWMLEDGREDAESATDETDDRSTRTRGRTP